MRKTSQKDLFYITVHIINNRIQRMRENEILWWVKSFFKGRLCLGIWCSIHLNVCTDVQHNSDGSKHLKKFRLSELCESLTWIRTTKGKRTTTIICIISFGNHILSVCLSRYSSAFITDVFTALSSKAIYYTSKISFITKHCRGPWT